MNINNVNNVDAIDNINERQYMLSTNDNPFNPFEDFHQWFMFDIEHHYNCCGYFDRIAKFTDDMTENEINEETERAIDEIIMNDELNIYIKVSADLVIT